MCMQFVACLLFLSAEKYSTLSSNLLQLANLGLSLIESPCKTDYYIVTCVLVLAVISH